jgi:hypothetical protein
VAGPTIAGLPKSVNLRGLALETAGSRRRLRAFAALATGAALFVTSWVALQSDLAGAANVKRGVLAALAAALDPARAAEAGAPRLVEIPLDPGPPSPRRKRAGANATAAAARRPVCVRLCDGFFFPAIPSASGGEIGSEEASCAALCPDAPTALYFLPAGSDRIEDGATVSGERYAALPAALRYRTGRDGACACRRADARDPPYWEDPTLRKGDAVMTPRGLLVFRGEGGAPHSPADFATLAAAPMPRDRRAALAAIERAGVPAAGAEERREIVAAAPPDADARGANEIRFLEAPAPSTN